MLNNTGKPAHIEYQAGHTSLERSAFCWRPYWSSRFESLWSLLRKFAHLNAINHNEVLKLFKCNEPSRTAERQKWCLRSDLRQFGALDPLKLAIIFGLSHKDLAEAIVLQYVHEHEAGTLTSEFLRYCPTCMSQGFHSPLHQLLFLNTCPAHGDTLESHCIDCFNQTIPYKLPSVSSKDILACVHMLHGLKHHLMNSKVEDLRKEAADREKAMSLLAKWLMKRVELNTPEQPIDLWIPQTAGRRLVARYIKRLSAYWADVFTLPNACRDSLNISKPKDTHIQVRFRDRLHTSEISDEHCLDDDLSVKATEALSLELYRIYKAIRRYLLRRYFLHHRKCIEKIGRDLLWERLILKCEGTICPVANALLLWRIFWEDVDKPNQLFIPPRRPKPWFKEPQQQRIDWHAPTVTLPDRALRRVFTIECIGTLYECFLLAEAFYRRKAYSFQPGYITGRQLPYWLIEASDDGEFTIHWWIRRSLSSLLNQNSSHFSFRRMTSCPENSPYGSPLWPR